MPQILAPYLEGFRVFAEFFAKAYQHVPEGMRIKIRQPGGGEGILEYLPDRRGARPAFRLKTLRRKTLVFVMALFRARENRGGVGIELHFPQFPDPIQRDFLKIIIDGKKERVDPLAEFCIHPVRLLLDVLTGNIDMFQAQGRQSPIPHAC